MTGRRDAATPRPIRTIFLGSGRFAEPMLQVVAGRPDLDLVTVITPPDRAAGRDRRLTPVPVAAAALARGLPLLQIGRIRAQEAVSSLVALRPQFGVLADFGQIVPPEILALPELGMLNIHPSLLPRHRGATPIQATLLAGDTVAGVSIMWMDAGLDTGPLAGVRSWDLDGTEDAPGLERRAAREGAELLDEVITAVLLGTAERIPQDDRLATLSRPLTRDSGRLDPLLPTALLERQVRAFRPWPGTFLEITGLRLVVVEAAMADRDTGDVPGVLVAHGAGLALATADGRLVLEVVQPSGGRPMPGADLLRGRPSLLGMTTIRG